MQKEPPPFIWAAPEERDILIWNFIIRGPPDSPYKGGEYHGVIMFPPEYPFKPPGIKMLTPSGRFAPGKKICFSMSDYHPASWNPAWSVSTILTGLLSFMLSDEMTTGSVQGTESDRKILASRSHAWNIAQSRFRDAFPAYSKPTMVDLPNMGEVPRKPEATKTPSARPVPDATDSAPGHQIPANPINPSWTSGIAQLIWTKWHWGVLLAFAVVVSRLTVTR